MSLRQDRASELVVSDPILEIRNASVTFDLERGENRVLDNVSIGLERGEILGVVGESGSGKSMFASALLDAIVRPGILTGELLYHPANDESVDVLDLSAGELREYRWEEVAMVFQGAMSSFNPTSTIRRHFVETLEAHDADVDSGLERTREILADLYLDPDRVLESYAHELSGGMQQRTLIALSLVLKPNVLVMDEPTAALDLLMQRSILSLLREIKEKYDITMVFITHDLPLVTHLADRIGVMYAFKFIEVGTTKEMLENPSHPYTAALLESTPNLDIPIEELRPISGSSPAPGHLPSGCSYHPRCSLADEDCIANEPPFYEVTNTHRSACFHWANVESNLELDNLGEDSP